MSDSLIRLEHISKHFGPVRANHDITLDIRGGRIKALLGENGAGKSTLMSMLAGRLQPDNGRIVVDGKPTIFRSARDAIGCGIGMVYQHFMLVDAMSVAENIFLGQIDSLLFSPRKLEKRVERLGRRYGLPIDPRLPVSRLSMGERQRVEILKLLQRQSRILIFDEPTAVLTPQEIEQLFTALRQMAQQGKAIVFITHKLSEVMRMADDVAILRKGQVVADMPADRIESKADLARRMVGREVLLDIDKTPMEPRQIILKVDHVSGNGLDEVSLELRQGEILAVVGVAGNGQKPLAETICGLLSPQQGHVQILGQSWKQYFAKRRWEAGQCYIPEDRLGLATCRGLDLVDNFLLTTRFGFCQGPWLHKAAATDKTSSLIQGFHIHPQNPHALARQLSGGNLQKLVLAREFFRRPRLVVAEQPTQGLDIGATEDVWRVLLKARERAGILLITGDLKEALTLADRVCVMFGGAIMDTFDADDADKVAHIGLLMTGERPAEST